MRIRGIVLTAVMAATAVVGVASPAQAYVECQDGNVSDQSYTVRCRSWTYGASYNAYVICSDGRRVNGPYYFLSGNNNWGPWSTATCPGSLFRVDHGVEKYG